MRAHASESPPCAVFNRLTDPWYAAFSRCAPAEALGAGMCAQKRPVMGAAADVRAGERLAGARARTAAGRSGKRCVRRRARRLGSAAAMLWGLRSAFQGNNQCRGGRMQHAMVWLRPEVVRVVLLLPPVAGVEKVVMRGGWRDDKPLLCHPFVAAVSARSACCKFGPNGHRCRVDS